MANWCHNRVRFTGEPDRVAQVTDFFKSIEEQQTLHNNYDLPAFITANNNGMFEIWLAEEHIHFRSAWQPPLEALCQISDQFGVGFRAKFEESGMFVYGKAYYQNEELDLVRLTGEDMAKITYDPDREVFLYEGNEFDNDETIIYSLFNKKIADYESANLLRPENNSHAQTGIAEPSEPDQGEHQKKGYKR